MRIDPHSYTDDQQPIVESLEWKANIDFSAHVIRADAFLKFSQPGSGPLDLDTRSLRIFLVEDFKGNQLQFELFAPETFFGQRLRVNLVEPSQGVRISYETSPDASALQWLAPKQTSGGKLPFLFSQCQAIHARSVIPLQDTPKRRITYRAEVSAPREMRVLMGAGFVSREEKGILAVEVFEMPQPIPPYLLALAVGDLVCRDLAPRSRVWAEPSLLDRAAYEFAQVDSMLLAAEKLFGPYDWERFDFLLLPPSFPYGGMENPRLTFLTPTLLAGDRSLVDVLAHELAHSWAGNLVTNATAVHFWLNEGLTVYAERRIIEALHGHDVAAVGAANGWQSLLEAIADFSDRPQFTRLRTDLEGIDPDNVYSIIPYEKGYLFFKALEQALGRSQFDLFLRKYMTHFRFKSISTEEFIGYLEESIPGALEKFQGKKYLFEAGVPAGAHPPKSQRIQNIQDLKQGFPSEDQLKSWITAEWQIWLAQIATALTIPRCEEIDRKLHLTSQGNFEILVSWLEVSAAVGYLPAIQRAEGVLREVGRMKYLKPLYRVLAKQNLDRTRELFEESRTGYHSIAVQVIETLLKKQ